MNKFKLTRDEKKAIPFILPGVIVTASLIIYPLFYIISMSFSENAIGQSGFAGLTNYLRLFKNPMFTSAINNIGSCYMSGDFFTVQTDLTSVIKIKSGNKDSHAHCSKQNGDRVYLVDLGEGKISSYCLKSPKELFVDEFIIEKNEGPRQILNWKHGMFAAVINEQSSTISYWKLDQDGKPAKRLCTINTTQKDEKNAPGDACIWKDRLLFVGNRGSETIAAFSLEKLGEKIGEWDCYGSFPRGLIITEDDYIIVSCQKSGTVITFKWDYENKTILKCDSLYLPGATNVIELTSEEDEK